MAWIWVKDNKRLLLCSLGGGFCYALMWGLGRALDTCDSVWQAGAGKTVFLLWIPFSLCMGLVFRFGSRLLCIGNRIEAGKNSFFYSWACIILCWIPVWLASWPGIFSYDSAYQIDWFLTGNLKAHHPLLHTAYLGGCIAIGQKVFGSDMVGALLYVVSQMLILSALLAGIHVYILKRSRSLWIQAGSLAFFALYPWNGLLSLCATKDVLFGGVFGIFLMQLMEAVSDKEAFYKSWKRQCLFGVTLFFVFALRNNGIHTILLCAPFLLFYFRKYWEKLLILLSLCCSIYFFYAGPVYQMLGVAKGETREMLSVVIQQIARVYRDAGDSWDEEEKNVVLHVIEERGLRRYHSHISDPVKIFFDDQAFAKDPVAFLKIWAELGQRYPKSYVDSFLANTYGFWYPMETVPESSGKRYIEYECYTPCDSFTLEMDPKLEGLNSFLYKLSVGEIPQRKGLVKFFLSTAFSFWVLLAGFFVLLYRKKWRDMIALLPLFAYFLTVLLGPVAIMRYVYCMIVCIPLVVYWAFEGCTEEKRQGKGELG